MTPIQNQKGQGMTEYIILVALIAIVAIGAVRFFGNKTKEGFEKACKKEACKKEAHQGSKEGGKEGTQENREEGGQDCPQSQGLKSPSSKKEDTRHSFQVLSSQTL